MEEIRILGKSVEKYLYNFTDELVVITPYYNPLGYQSRRKNYEIFVGLLRRSGIRVITVECAFGDQPFDLPDAIDVLKLRCKSLLWQKERILNLALPWLPPGCKYVAWLDCDLVFTNPNWARDTVALLQEVPVVQVFETCKRLDQNIGDASCGGSVWESFAKIVSQNPTALASGVFKDHGHTGYGWAARRDVLEWHGLYEYGIAGAGDDYMSHAFMGDLRSGCFLWTFQGNPERLRHFLEWAEPFANTVQGKLKAVPGEILHLWHGDLGNRQYGVRHQQFRKFRFNPYTDLIAMPGRPFELKPDATNPELNEWFQSYFENRREDGVLAAAA